MIQSDYGAGAAASDAIAPSSKRRRVIIVAPHFPPSNLASVHRSRLFAPHLRDFGWEPVVVTVHHSFYEEPLDWNLAKLIPHDLRVERVRALPTKPVRVVGDIGIRGFIPMLRRILDIVDREGADFLYITIPSFFAAPLGRITHALRGIPYGIDYIDPWVHVFPGSEKRLSKAWLSRKLAEILEPPSVRNASLITGVTDRSYHDVLARNRHLIGRAVTSTMPYGGEVADHTAARELALQPRLFKNDSRFRVTYAGTMWDAAQEPLDRIFRSISRDRNSFDDVVFHFIGTGASPTNPIPQIRPLAERHGIWGDIVVEHPQRIPYLDVLAHLEASDAVFIFGGTKAHYTPSKLYQGVLSGKPLLAVLHKDSPATSIIAETNAGRVLSFDGEEDLGKVENSFAPAFREFRQFAARFDASCVDRGRFDAYSARNVGRQLAQALDLAMARVCNETSSSRGR